MNIDKKIQYMFLLVLSLGWFYSGAVWLFLDVLGIKEYLEIHNPWDIFICCAIGHALTAAQAASVVYKN
jgi:hypothetical protein